ncbi:MAG: sulfatase-like hydrolase/transferase [Chloroflexota bacterium]
MTDQQKATASHLWGNTFCETPALQRLANEGVVYDHAFTPHPLCMPARVSFWTSQYPHTHGSRRNEIPMPADATHAFKLWKEAGYTTGLIGKNHCFEQPSDLDWFDVYCEISHGGLPAGAETTNSKTKGMEWFRPVESINAAHELRRTMTPQNPRFAYATSDFPLEDYSTGLVAGQTVRYLEQFSQREDDSPFALWVSIPDPHEPWVVPEQYAALFPPEKIDLPPSRDGEFTDGTAPDRNRILYEMLNYAKDDIQDVYGLLAVYYGMVRFIDDGVGQILDALERLDLRDETIVVFCSDHGDFSGEHQMQCKGGVFYDCLTRVPLIVSCPAHMRGELPRGVRDDSMVNLIDIVPTLLTHQGIDIPRSMQGQPLPSVTDAPPRDATFSEYGAGGPAFTLDDLAEMQQPYGRHTLIDTLRWREAEGRRKMVRTREWKYVHDAMGGKDELYDMINDPWELLNVAGDLAYGDVLAEMRLRLADWSVMTEDGAPVPLP